MQLTPSRPVSVRLRLAAATCALLGVASGPAVAAEGTSSALLYTEPDGVTAFETRADYLSELADGRIAHLHVTFDALTGSSPNGALTSGVPQTFTRPSGASSFTIAPGKKPIDPDFSDKRVEGGASLDVPLGDALRGTAGATASHETDYLSFGASGRLSRDFFQHNTTLSFGLSGSVDNVRAKGGTPTALAPVATEASESSLLREDDEGEGGDGVTGSEMKWVGDVLAGLTQVIDPSTLMQFNYSRSFMSGYLTDPYKLVSVVQGEGGAAPGDPVGYLFENRPDRRTKQAVFWEGKHTFGRDVLDLSYRYLWDDWGIRSSTVGGQYLLEATETSSLEPQVRWYHQTAVDFYTHSLVEGAALPAFTTADNRLGEFYAWTYALKYTHRLRTGSSLGLRVGYYVQTGNSHPPDAIGSQKDQDLFPRVTAILTQVSYSLHL